MRKLKVGYWPLSPSLNSAGDRRRIVFWANARGHSIVTDQDQRVDVIVASENSDFNSGYFTQGRTPVIFDLVDAYLSPLNYFDDLARGFAKRITGHLSGAVKPFSNHVRDFCLNSNAVICSSIEQEELIKPYNSNTHVILDSHGEIPFVDPSSTWTTRSANHHILWEGQPATIRGVKLILPALSEVSKSNSLNLDFVTDEKHFRFLNRFVERDTLQILSRDLEEFRNKLRIISWTPKNLVACAKASSVAIIPIDLSVPMQRMKPENRLLIMWRLGLPCLTSASPAYNRVSQHAGVSASCDSLEDWSEQLDRLINDRAFAHREITAGQNYLRMNHSSNVLLKKWDLAVESAMA